MSEIRIDEVTAMAVLLGLVGALQWGATGALGVDIFSQLGIGSSLESTIQLAVAASAGYGIIDVGGEL